MAKLNDQDRILDEVKIYCKSGKGGNGCVSFRREKYIEFGGPDGGNGGWGGNIIVVSTSQKSTLIDFRRKRIFEAPNGKSGAGRNRTGESGANIILEVPVGTQIISNDINCVLFDFENEGMEFLLAKGGRGGAGNAVFKSSTNRSPEQRIEGADGEEIDVTLRLKMLCDIGLVGLPNAGKSSFLKSVTNAKPKIANYAFTTLSPNLGIFSIDFDDYVIADIPGLVEGASTGKGLGDKFLKHIERSKILFHILDASDDNFLENYNTIRSELENYDKLFDSNILNKTEIIFFNKTDLMLDDEISTRVEQLKQKTKSKIFLWSNFTGQNLKEIFLELPNLLR